MLLFYKGLLALSSWAEIVLSIVILDTNDNRILKLRLLRWIVQVVLSFYFFVTSLLMTKVLPTTSMLMIDVIVIYGHYQINLRERTIDQQ